MAAAAIQGSVYSMATGGYEACLWLEGNGGQIGSEVYGTGATASDAVASASAGLDYEAAELA